MKRGLYTGSKNKRFDYAEDTFQRMSIAVKEENDSDIIATIIPKGKITGIEISDGRKYATIEYTKPVKPRKRKRKNSFARIVTVIFKVVMVLLEEAGILLKRGALLLKDAGQKIKGAAIGGTKRIEIEKIEQEEIITQIRTENTQEFALENTEKNITENIEEINTDTEEKIKTENNRKFNIDFKKIKLNKINLKDIFGRYIKKAGESMKVAAGYVKAEKNRSKVALSGSIGLIVVALAIVLINFSVGFEAVVNGQSVGIVTSKRACEQIIDEVNAELVDNFGPESKIEAKVVAVPKLVSKKAFTDTHDVKDAICALSDKMHQMYVIYLNDTQLCALASEEEAQAALDAFREYYTGGREGVTFTTASPLTIVCEQAPITLLHDVKEATSILRGSEKKENEYTIVPGDNLWAISRRFDTSVEEILAINPGLSENIVDGDVISVKSYVPVVTVTTTEIKEYTEPIGYETEIIETDSMYRGRSEITQKGVNGELAVVANVTKQNGYEIERDILSETRVKEPVTQIKKVGTKKPPAGYGTGTFIAPVTGTITSYYGYRKSGFHKGIDIANSYGTPIRAADNGKVIFAGWSGLFGKLVKIDHRNGYVTYYAHNSSFAVKVGDTVQKGDVIAYMGSTGNSTGSHCHFEIYKNGVLKNPSNYI